MPIKAVHQYHATTDISRTKASNGNSLSLSEVPLVSPCVLLGLVIFP